jgi:Zn-dependent protease
MSERFRDLDWPPDEPEPDDDPYAARELELRDYDPIHPGGFSIRRVLGRIWAVILAVGLAALKFGALTFKFFGIFISVAAYALIWGWRFAAGFVVLILVHEMGHFIEARRQGLRPALPVFVPFLGAYVAIKDAPHDPWRNGLISIAGPILGSFGALVCLALANAMDSDLLRALAYSGFLLNLFNLIPVFPLDGGFIGSATRALWRHGPRSQAVVLGGATLTLAALLVLGMMSAHVGQDRL